MHPFLYDVGLLSSWRLDLEQRYKKELRFGQGTQDTIPSFQHLLCRVPNILSLILAPAVAARHNMHSFVLFLVSSAVLIYGGFLTFRLGPAWPHTKRLFMTVHFGVEGFTGWTNQRGHGRRTLQSIVDFGVLIIANYTFTISAYIIDT